MGTVERAIIEGLENCKAQDKNPEFIVIGRAHYKKLCMSNIAMSGDESIDGVLYSFHGIPLVVVEEKNFLEIVPKPDLTYLES